MGKGVNEDYRLLSRSDLSPNSRDNFLFVLLAAEILDFEV